MNVRKLRQALALLQAFVTELPNGDIDEHYILLYNRILNDIRDETGQDLSYFQISILELPRRIKGRDHLSSIKPTSPDESYCERPRFLISLKGAVNFINSITLDYGANTLPLIEPPK